MNRSFFLLICLGELTRATFHGKAFIDEMTQMIHESNCDRAKQIRLLFQTPDHSFFDFSLYFGLSSCFSFRIKKIIISIFCLKIKHFND